jgi:periplasmic divalent cation tolerance protein
VAKLCAKRSEKEWFCCVQKVVILLPENDSFLVVLMTSASAEEAQEIADTLVAKRLAACVNIVGGCKSIYRWQGKICRDDEFLMIAKTHESRFEEFKTTVTTLHSYEVPEIISLRITAGAESYMSFLEDSLQIKGE